MCSVLLPGNETLLMCFSVIWQNPGISVLLFLFLVMGGLKVVAFVQKLFFSFIFIKDIKNINLGQESRIISAPFSYCFLSLPHISKSNCFSGAIFTISSCSCSSWLQRRPSLDQGQVKSRLSTHILILPTPRPLLFSVQLTQDPSRTVLRVELPPMECPTSWAS